MLDLIGTQLMAIEDIGYRSDESLSQNEMTKSLD